jgi:hypothetical protein
MRVLGIYVGGSRLDLFFGGTYKGRKDKGVFNEFN